MSAKVTLQDVERVAELANLDLAEAEKPRMQRDLNAILEYIAELSQLDTTGVEPMAQVSDLLDNDLLDSVSSPASGMAVGAVTDAGNGELLRPDALKSSVDRARVMAEAPESDGAFFKVPRVIER